MIFIFKVYILGLATFSIGFIELVINGILPDIASDLNISVSQASYFITIFAFIFAFSGPICIKFIKMERKNLLLIVLFLFIIVNFISFVGTTFIILFIARILTAILSGIIASISIIMAPQIVDPSKKNNAIGLIFTFLSASLVLGIPIGVIVNSTIGWRYVFLIAILLSIVSVLLINKYIERIPVVINKNMDKENVSRFNISNIYIHISTLLFLAGHSSIYTFLVPYLNYNYNFSTELTSLLYFIMGISSIIGTKIGTYFCDVIGSKKTITLNIILLIITLSILYLPNKSILILILILCIWGCLSWSLVPAVQSYILYNFEEVPLNQSINTSSIQLGISLGTIIGSTLISSYNNINLNPLIGSILCIFSLGFFILNIFSNRKIAN